MSPVGVEGRRGARQQRPGVPVSRRRGPLCGRHEAGNGTPLVKPSLLFCMYAATIESRCDTGRPPLSPIAPCSPFPPSTRNTGSGIPLTPVDPAGSGDLLSSTCLTLFSHVTSCSWFSGCLFCFTD